MHKMPPSLFSIEGKEFPVPSFDLVKNPHARVCSKSLELIASYLNHHLVPPKVLPRPLNDDLKNLVDEFDYQLVSKFTPENKCEYFDVLDDVNILGIDSFVYLLCARISILVYGSSAERTKLIGNNLVTEKDLCNEKKPPLSVKIQIAEKEPPFSTEHSKRLQEPTFYN